MPFLPTDGLVWRRRVATLGGAVSLGLAALAFAAAADRATAFFKGWLAPHPWVALGAAPIVFMIAALCARRLFPGSGGSGIPQVIALVHRPERTASSGLLALPVAAAKGVLTCLALMVGAAVGREGPTVQIAAAINTAVHRWLKVPLSPGVLIAGGAAGVAAAFNTPLAGVAFAIEELASAYEQRVAVLVMMTVMVAGLISLGIAGDYVYLGALRGTLPLRTALIVTPIAGIVGGVAGGLFSRMMQTALGGWGTRIGLRRRPILFAGACGLVVALMGWLSGGTSWGTGYETTRHLVEGAHVSWAAFLPRAVATLATAISGIPGGIFAPSLTLGAEIGNMIASLMPGTAAGPIVLLGMIAYFTGVVRAPLTAVIIVSEATASHALIIPLFAAALIADGVSALVMSEKLYHGLSRAFEPVETVH